MHLVDQFIMNLQSIQASHTSRVHTNRDVASRLIGSGIQGVIQAARQSERVIFTDTTVRMLGDKLRDYEHTVEELLSRYAPNEQAQAETLSRFMIKATQWDGGWLLFPKPIQYPQGTFVSGILAFSPSRYLSTGKDALQVMLITPEVTIAEVFTFVPGEPWFYQEAYHHCPFCTQEEGVLLLCDACRDKIVVWSKLFSLSAIIAGQYLAAVR